MHMQYNKDDHYHVGDVQGQMLSPKSSILSILPDYIPVPDQSTSMKKFDYTIQSRFRHFGRTLYFNEMFHVYENIVFVGKNTGASKLKVSLELLP